MGAKEVCPECFGGGEIVFNGQTATIRYACPCCKGRGWVDGLTATVALLTREMSREYLRVFAGGQR